ncbi:Pentatricopeptide repeat-containing protein DOT4, chloroplastic [Vitis vinifera]|uniref:Pentatricopeptide repeat-containing protein DOT4, chloroplastic n=1 Tax=Vitis vinifera TaxID=29760 RepID=A0A438JKP8_VITVI|nr:Pentatricopeptide repeat-containing protein DOT4, chloroplastic [Vitis vinifera]
MSQKSIDFGLTHQLFDEIPVSNTFAWNNLIQTHLTNGDSDRVVSTYRQMLLRGVRPDKHTIPRILTAARHTSSFSFGKQVHGHALKLGLSSESYVISALLEMYGRLDGANAAKLVFCKSARRNSVSWTLISRLYIMEDKPGLAVDMFKQMVESKSEIDPLALVTAIVACGMLKSLQEGRYVHEIAKKCGLEADVLVSNSLLKMYIDCGSIKDARAVFDRMPSKDVISWTEIFRGYVKNGGFNEGLKLFRQMSMEGVKPDSLAISSILPACGRGAAHKQGKEIHAYLLRNGIDLNVTVQNAVLDMYVKSGFIESAAKIFAGMKDRDAISWTVMILGYSLHGQGELGVDLFRKMEKNSSVEIDQIAYAAALHACTTARLVEQGRFYFNCITAPKSRHYALMVALLSRVGLFDEARVFMEEHKLEGHVEVLRALLDGCRIHHNMRTAKRVIEQLCDLQTLNADNYVLLSNWYSSFAKWDMVNELRETIRDMGLKPRKAYSWIEFRNKFMCLEQGMYPIQDQRRYTGNCTV